MVGRWHVSRSNDIVYERVVGVIRGEEERLYDALREAMKETKEEKRRSELVQRYTVNLGDHVQVHIADSQVIRLVPMTVF